jgi:hypothetical protein
LLATGLQQACCQQVCSKLINKFGTSCSNNLLQVRKPTSCNKFDDNKLATLDKVTSLLQQARYNKLGTTSSVQQAWYNKLGTTSSVQQARYNKLGTTSLVQQARYNKLGTTSSVQQAWYNKLVEPYALYSAILLCLTPGDCTLSFYGLTLSQI